MIYLFFYILFISSLKNTCDDEQCRIATDPTRQYTEVANDMQVVPNPSIWPWNPLCSSLFKVYVLVSKLKCQLIDGIIRQISLRTRDSIRTETKVASCPSVLSFCNLLHVKYGNCTDEGNTYWLCYTLIIKQTNWVNINFHFSF